MPSEIPMVSAIMPTRGRQQWAADAVRMFREQTWPSKELVVIDDMMERSFPNGLNGEGIQYHVAPRVTIGEKRNLAVSRASGEIICHRDSDDIYRADCMEHQVNLLINSGADMVGYHELEFEDAELGIRYYYRASGGYPIGATQCYWRDVWEAKRFEPKDTGEDEAFFGGRSTFCVPADGRVTARIHSGNTSDKRVHIPTNPAQWQRIA